MNHANWKEKWEAQHNEGFYFFHYPNDVVTTWLKHNATLVLKTPPTARLRQPVHRLIDKIVVRMKKRITIIHYKIALWKRALWLAIMQKIHLSVIGLHAHISLFICTVEQKFGEAWPKTTTNWSDIPLVPFTRKREKHSTMKDFISLILMIH